MSRIMYCPNCRRDVRATKINWFWFLIMFVLTATGIPFIVLYLLYCLFARRRICPFCKKSIYSTKKNAKSAGTQNADGPSEPSEVDRPEPKVGDIWSVRMPDGRDIGVVIIGIFDGTVSYLKCASVPSTYCESVELESENRAGLDCEVFVWKDEGSAPIESLVMKVGHLAPNDLRNVFF